VSRIAETWAVPALCLLVAAIALAAAWASGSPDQKKPEPAFVGFPDSSGARWQSLSASGSLRLTGEGKFWLAFRGFSLGKSAVLSVAGDDGSQATLRLGERPGVHFVGPLYLNGGGTYFLDRESAGPQAEERTIFVSEPRLARRPLAALPAAGFWPAEFLKADDTYANWLHSRGTIIIASRSRTLTEAWIAFNLTSIDTERTVTVDDRRRRSRIRAPERGANRRITLGPFRLRNGRARLTVSSPGPLVYGGDPRRRSVRLSSLEAFPKRPSD
jgi:hypothetical protein